MNTWKQEWDKLKPMSNQERAEYIWEYYRIYLVIGLGFLLLGWVLLSAVGGMVRSTLYPGVETSVAIAFSETQNCDVWFQDAAEKLGMDGQTEFINVLSTSSCEESKDIFNYKLVMWTSANQPDLLLCDETTLDFARTVLPLADLSNLNSGDAEMLIRENTAVAVDISGTELVSVSGLSGKKVWICLIEGHPGYDRAVQLLQHILK